MLKIEFTYKDFYTNGMWNHQTCIVSSMEMFKEIYSGVIDDKTCEYKLLSVEEVED